MSDIGDLLRSGVDAALEAQGPGATSTSDVKARVLRRGRRRLAVRVSGAILMSLVLVAGAASATSALLRRDVEVATPDVPEMGAEVVVEMGGPLASDGHSLWIGSGATSNTEGDRNGISRFDIATGESVDGPPAVGLPQAMAAGPSGIWSVGWQGDMPVGGKGHPVRGAIERVDPVTLERTGYIPREDSAPHDVAVGTAGGKEVAWVVDTGRHELLRVDAETMEVAETYDTPRVPVSVFVHDRFVYVTSSDEHAVWRLDVETEETTTFDVPRCATDIVVGGGSLWVADFCGDALHRIDEDGSGDVVSVRMEQPSALEYAEGLVWVAASTDVVRVDPGSNEIVGNSIYVSEMNDGLLYAGGSMWVQTWGSVYRLSEDAPPATPTPTPPPTPDPRGEALPPGVERVPVERDPAALETGAGSLWTGMFEIVRLDPATGDVQAEVDPGGFVRSMDFDEDAGVLWAFVEVAQKEKNAVVAIDPATDEVALGPVLLDPPGVYGQAMAARNGVAWVAGDPTLWRIELATGDTQKIDIGRHFGGPDETSGFNVVATDDAVFVVPVNGTILRVDAETREIEKVGDLGWNVDHLVSDGETVWLEQTSAETSEILLWTLDGTTGHPAGEPVVVGKFGAPFLAQHEGLVWVAQAGMEKGAISVKAYEAGTGDPVRSAEVPASPFVQGAAAGPEGFWITTGHDFVYRVDAE